MTALAALLIGSSAAASELFATADGIAFAEGLRPPGTQLLTTNTVTVTVTGAAGPVTHSWAFVSGNNIFTISDSTAAAVSWSVLASIIEREAIWRDTVSDGVSIVTVDVTVSAFLS